MTYDSIVVISALLFGVALSWLDCKTRRLPNWMTLGGAAVTLVWRFGYGGLPLFLDGFAAAGTAGAFMLLPFLMRGAGGGDVKMRGVGSTCWQRTLSERSFTATAAAGRRKSAWPCLPVPGVYVWSPNVWRPWRVTAHEDKATPRAHADLTLRITGNSERGAVITCNYSCNYSPVITEANYR